MERRIFGKKTLYNQRPRVDRFVIPRDRLYTLQSGHSWHANCADQEDVEIWNPQYLRQKKFAKYLEDTFDMEPVSRKTPTGLDCVPPWPCVPRKNSYLSPADGILDLPNYSNAVFPELLDWSSDNILVAALGDYYHKWSWTSQSVISEGLTRFPIQCCKFDPRGELLALGTETQMLEIHDNTQSKPVTYCFCKCISMHPNSCAVTALDWSPTGNSFVSGCSWGTVIAYSRSGVEISSRQVSDRKPVLAVRVSPDARFIATTCFSSAIVYFLTWPSLQLHSVMNGDFAVRTIAWHPWRSALLAIGKDTTNMQARIVLWDAPSSKIRETMLGHKQYSIDTMLFSRKSGELVLSLWNTGRSIQTQGYFEQCRLVVLSNPDTVVDQWGECRNVLDRIRTMVFSPDGTKLATASAEEDLIIWNFLPEDKVKKKSKYKNFSALPVYLDEVNQGFSLR